MKTIDDTKVESCYNYPLVYKPKKLEEQTQIINDFFDLGSPVGLIIDATKKRLSRFLLPPNSEGIFVVPHWRAVSPSYNEAVQKVFSVLQNERRFVNMQKNEEEKLILGCDPRTAKAFEILSQQIWHKKPKAGSDNFPHILIVPAQLGIRYRGWAPKKVLEALKKNEFCLDVFTVSIILLTHPERFTDIKDLWIDCAGSKCSLFQNTTSQTYRNRLLIQEEQTPYFWFKDGKVYFSIGSSSNAAPIAGSATGFTFSHVSI